MDPTPSPPEPSIPSSAESSPTRPRLTGILDLDSIIVSYLSVENMGTLLRANTKHAILHNPVMWYHRLCRESALPPVVEHHTDVPVPVLPPIPYDAAINWHRIYHVMMCRPVYGPVGSEYREGLYRSGPDGVHVPVQSISHIHNDRIIRNMGEKVRRLVRALASVPPESQTYQSASDVTVVTCPHPQCNPTYTAVEDTPPPYHVAKHWSAAAVNVLDALLTTIVDQECYHVQCRSSELTDITTSSYRTHLLRKVVEVVAQEGCGRFVIGVCGNTLHHFPQVESVWRVVQAFNHINRQVAGKEPDSPLDTTTFFPDIHIINWSTDLLVTLIKSPHCDLALFKCMWTSWVDGINILVGLHHRAEGGRGDWGQPTTTFHKGLRRNNTKLAASFIKTIDTTSQCTDRLERTEFVVASLQTLLALLWGSEPMDASRISVGSVFYNDSREYIYIDLIKATLNAWMLGRGDDNRALMDTVLRTLQAPVTSIMSMVEFMALGGRAGPYSLHRTKMIDAPVLFDNTVIRRQVAAILVIQFRRLAHSLTDIEEYYTYTRDAFEPLMGDDAPLVRMGEHYGAFIVGYNEGLHTLEPDYGLWIEDTCIALRSYCTGDNDDLQFMKHKSGGWEPIVIVGSHWQYSLGDDAMSMYCRALFYRYANQALSAANEEDGSEEAKEKTASAIGRIKVLCKAMLTLQWGRSIFYDTIILPATLLGRQVMEWVCEVTLKSKQDMRMETLYQPFHNLAYDWIQSFPHVSSPSFASSAEYLLGSMSQYPHTEKYDVKTSHALEAALMRKCWPMVRYLLRMLPPHVVIQNKGLLTYEIFTHLTYGIYDLPLDLLQLVKEVCLHPKTRKQAKREQGSGTRTIEVAHVDFPYPVDLGILTSNVGNQQRIDVMLPFVWDETGYGVLISQ